jgi:formamidopyrimidine-DNA glycosylase
MPELPDLQVFSKNLQKNLAGKKVEKVSLLSTAKLNVPVKTLQEAIENQVLDKVHRVGKRLFFVFNNGSVMAWHLLLNGELMIYKKSHDHKHAIIDILFTDGTGLVMEDFQRWAKIELNPEATTAVDPLSKELNYSFLKDHLGKTKTTVKKFLLDQETISGIGNAYADEILWHSGISPFSTCNKIPDEKIKALDKAIKSTLQDAEKKIHSINPETITGEWRDFLSVHNEKKTYSPGGGVIQFIVTGGRKTFFTDEQEMFK